MKEKQREDRNDHAEQNEPSQIEKIRNGSSVEAPRYGVRSQPQGQKPVTGPPSAVKTTTEPATSGNERSDPADRD